MPKGGAKGKSSASSATRKKQAAKAAARKAADGDGGGPPAGSAPPGPAKPQRGQKKEKRNKKEPKKKVFIPPPKPPQPPPDPLDSLGLAKSLDPDLVVLLRKAGKKDVITRTRALEALLEWIGHNASEKEADLVMMLPCWAHLFPRLSTSPTRRLRLLTAQIHAALLSPSSPSTRSELLLTPSYIEDMLGPFSILSFDTDRSVSRISRALWDDALSFASSEAESKICLGEEKLGILLAHLSLLLLTQSASASLSSHTPSLAAPSAPGSGVATPSGDGAGAVRDAKSRDDANVEEDTGAMDGRLVASALGVLDWCVGHQPDPKPAEAYDELLTSSQLWSALVSVAPTSSNGEANGDDEDEDSTPDHILGIDAPQARVRAWALLRTTLLSWPEMADKVVSLKGAELLSDAWAERDRNVQRSMLDALLPLLKSRPDIWEMKPARGGEQDEDEDEDAEEEQPALAPDPVEEEKDYEEVSAASDSDDEEDEGPEPQPVKASTPKTSSAGQASKRSAALSGFTTWLEQACGGYPEVAYPAALVLLSTIPAQLLPIHDAGEFTRFLDRLNAPLDARALDSSPLALRGFVSCSAECTAWLGNRLASTLDVGGKEKNEVRAALVEKVERMWDEFVMGPVPSHSGQTVDEEEKRLRKLRIRSAGNDVVVSEIGKSIRKLAAGPASRIVTDDVVDRSQKALQQLAGLAKDDEETARARYRLVALLAALNETGSNARLTERVTQLVVVDISGTVANLLCHAEDADNVAALLGLETEILRRFGTEHRKEGAQVFEVLCGAAESSIPLLLDGSSDEARVPSKSVAAFYHALLGLVEDGSKRAEIWSKVLAASAASPAAQLDLFDKVADSLPSGSLDDSTRRNRQALSRNAKEWLAKNGSSADGWDAASERVLARLIERPEPLIDAADAKEIRAQLASHVIQRANAESASRPLVLLDKWRKAGPAAERHAELRKVEGLPSALFELAFFEDSAVAREMWNDVATAGIASRAAQAIRSRCWDLSTPLVALGPAAEDLRARGASLAELIPDSERLESAYQDLAGLSPSPALAIVDALIPLDMDSSNSRPHSAYDAQSLSGYARSVLYFVEILESDRQEARRCLWTLPHIVLVAMLVEDRLLLDASSQDLLGPGINRQTLESLMQRLVRIATSQLSNAAAVLPDSFHQEAAEALQKGSPAVGGREEEPALGALRFAWRKGTNAARVFARILNGLLSFSAAGEDEASRWLRLGQVMQDREPALAMAVLATVKGLIEESPAYDRLRSELCSRLSGVPPSKAVAQGLPLLALVLAAAPSADSPTALLPQQRALFLVQAMQKWMASDEDLPPTIDTRLAQLLVLVLPIVQDQQGSHIDFAFDLVETILEPAGFEDKEGLPATFAGLRLLQALRDLALRNKTLREVWKERKDEALGMVHRLFLSLADASGDSAREGQTVAKTRDVPKDLCLDMLVDLLRDLPPSTFDAEADQNALIELVHGASSVIQVVSYRTLSATLREQVKRHVIELATRPSAKQAAEASDGAGAEGESKDKDAEAQKEIDLAKRSEIPSKLLAAVATPLDVENLADDETAEASDRSNAFAFFLCWLAILDHFEEASLNVRNVYSGQLNREGLLSTSLLPTVFAMTSSSAATGPLSRVPFDPSPFVVDEVFLDDIEPQSIVSLRMLATHVYYRALLHVPTLIREWWFSIKDRQLSTHVSDFTLHHCSPLVAASELAQLREPEALAELEDESLSVKVLGSSEVVATYTIDEHPMEIGVRIPKDYPLRPLEVQAKERVGVSEQQLRSWILLMTIQTEQTGRIFDAISFFKRSASSRFEEYQDGAECAICYSIVSPTDRSLPNKPCKTCKKQFHASCLFKWVSTSGSSTCPLCRSIL